MKIQDQNDFCCDKSHKLCLIDAARDTTSATSSFDGMPVSMLCGRIYKGYLVMLEFQAAFTPDQFVDSKTHCGHAIEHRPRPFLVEVF